MGGQASRDLPRDGAARPGESEIIPPVDRVANRPPDEEKGVVSNSRPSWALDALGRGSYGNRTRTNAFDLRNRASMAKRRRKHDTRSKSSGQPRRRPGRRGASGGLWVDRSLDGKSWILKHPRCVRERADDLDEVRAMIAAGELDVAIDELRWLVDGCRELLEGHYLLGRLAVEADNDVALARGHFGFGFQLGEKALGRERDPHPLPALHPANRAFFDAGRGLAWCLHELGKTEMAIEVIRRLLDLDVDDSLGVGAWIDEISTSGATLVSPEQLFNKPTS